LPISIIMDESYNSDVMQKYPWRGKFGTKKEIDTYLTGNKIECLLCGKWFRALPTHLERTHNITADDYKERYGLPWKRGLCGVGLSKKRSKLLLERLKNGFKPPIEVAMKKSVGAPRRPDQPFFVKVKLENMRAGSDKFRKYDDKDFYGVLAKMLKEKKGLNEVCKDPDMPQFGAVSKYAKKNADFRKELEKTYEQLPYRVQAGACRLPEKKFKEDLLTMKRSNITVADMSRLLGVSRSMIHRRLKNE
jgi:hypothetical protein